jgi:hypothetical protein
MKRGQWSLWSRRVFGTDGDPYLARRRIIQTPWFGIFVHQIFREDQDRDPHDHPFAFLTLILWRGYTERYWPDKRNLARYRDRVRHLGSLRFVPRRGAHIITAVHRPAPGKPVWTVVFVGRDHDDWGFWTSDGYVPWQEYVDRWPVAAADPQLPRSGRAEDSPL